MVVTQGTRTAEIVAESLFDWGVEVIFGLPGDGINGFIEALRRRKDRIKFVLVRHEESAAFMACAYAKYTGKLGACVATSGPGAIHLLTGLYDAKADSTPVIAITGSTYSDMMGSHYQQDVDLLQLFSDVAVYNNMINSPDPALLSRAADILNSGERVVLLVGQGALEAGMEVETVSDRLGAPIVKALLGKAVVPDDLQTT